MLVLKLLTICVLAVALPTQEAALLPNETQAPDHDSIVYVSSDLDRAAVFFKDRAVLGTPMMLSRIWPSTGTIYLEPEEGVQCISIGPEGSSVQFAIKRPIKKDDTYTCGQTKFRTLKCFFYCRAAIVRVRAPLGSDSRDFLDSYLYVDDCFGVVAFSQSRNLTKEIPLNAELLRGPVGILANKNYPGCRPF